MSARLRLWTKGARRVLAAARAGVRDVAGSDDVVLATTTSSLSVTDLGVALGVGQRFVSLEVFNPVPKMALVALAFGACATPDVRRRARELCTALDEQAIEVPDTPGFIVNKLLFRTYSLPSTSWTPPTSRRSRSTRA